MTNPPPAVYPPKDANRRRIYLMRHGSVTYFTPEGKPIEPDSVPLNSQGRQQADAAGQAFAQAGVKFDRVITSTLPRTIETAQRVLAQINQTIALEQHADLVEIKGADLAKIPDDQLQQAFCGALDNQGPLTPQGMQTKFLGGETIAQLLDRVIPPLQRLRADQDWDVCLLVLHGGVNRALLASLLMGQPQFFGGLAQAPACINAIDVGEHPQDVVMRLLNYSPTDTVQTSTRKTTMEALLEQYRKYRDRFTSGIAV